MRIDSNGVMTFEDIEIQYILKRGIAPTTIIGYARCPLSAAANYFIQRSANKYTSRGTDIHNLLEKAVNEKKLGEIPYIVPQKIIELFAIEGAKIGTEVYYRGPKTGVNCKMDAVIELPEEVIIIDWKTGSSNGKIKSRLPKSEYSFQMCTYMKEMKLKYPDKEVKGILVNVDNGTAREVEIYEGFDDELRFKVAIFKRAKQMLEQTKQMEGVSNFRCSGCLFKDACKDGKAEAVNAKIEEVYKPRDPNKNYSRPSKSVKEKEDEQVETSEEIEEVKENEDKQDC